MALTNRELVILGVLLFCVPLQFWLSKLSSLTSEEKGMKIQAIIIENKLRIQTLFTPSLWVFWLKDVYKSLFIKGKFFIKCIYL